VYRKPTHTNLYVKTNTPPAPRVLPRTLFLTRRPYDSCSPRNTELLRNLAPQPIDMTELRRKFLSPPQQSTHLHIFQPTATALLPPILQFPKIAASCKPPPAGEIVRTWNRDLPHIRPTRKLLFNFRITINLTVYSTPKLRQQSGCSMQWSPMHRTVLMVVQWTGCIPILLRAFCYLYT